MQNIGQTKAHGFKALIYTSCLGLLTLTGCQSTGHINQPIEIKKPTVATSSQDNQKSSEDQLIDNEDVFETTVDQEFDGQIESDSNYEMHSDELSEDDATEVHAKNISNAETSAESPVDGELINTEDSTDKVADDSDSDDKSETTSTRTPPAPAPAPTPPAQYPQVTQQILLERARQNSHQIPTQTTTIDNGNNIPAFRKLMDTGVKQLKNGHINDAEATFTRAQRLGPQSAAVYFYLGQVAIKKNQPLKAEAMARRGLVVAQVESRQRALWQVVLKAGQMQRNPKVIEEAKKALSHY